MKLDIPPEGIEALRRQAQLVGSGADPGPLRDLLRFYCLYGILRWRAQPDLGPLGRQMLAFRVKDGCDRGFTESDFDGPNREDD